MTEIPQSSSMGLTQALLYKADISITAIFCRCEGKLGIEKSLSNPEKWVQHWRIKTDIKKSTYNIIINRKNNNFHYKETVMSTAEDVILNN